MEMEMKNIFKFAIITVAAASVVFVSCSEDLVVNENEYHSKEYMFADFGKVKDIMTHSYGYLTAGFSAVGGTMTECATDDAVYANTPNTIKGFYDGSWSANNTMDDCWNTYYSAIRSCNYLIENCPEDYEVAKYLEEYTRNKEQLQNYPWEAKTLRAYYHFELLKRYNSIVIADRTFTPEEVNSLRQVDYATAAEWIADELLEASGHLPATYSGTYFSELGRCTRGFALALRSRVLLYEASPLNNPDNLTERYVSAAAAAKQMIDGNASDGNTFALVNENFGSESKGVIFAVRQGANNAFERANFPAGYEGGHSGVCPSLNLVEAFDMIDGTPYDRSVNSAALLDPAQRDPRFEKTVLYNGATFKDQTVETFRGGRNGFPLEEASPTSFYLRKFIQESTRLSAGNTNSYQHVWPIIRFPEVYLNYAEALFEATGNPYFTGSLSGVSFTMSPADAVSRVRAIYSLPALPAGLDADTFRARLRNERRVELAFEGHRFWDLRRWKAGDQSKDVYGLDIVKNSDETFTSTRTLVQSRRWEDKWYFYPISEVERHRNTNLTQNSGW